MTETKSAAERWAELATRPFHMREVFEILDQAVDDPDDDETVDAIADWLDWN